jgi:hypothetical protein
MQTFDAVPNCCQHALDLVVLPFGQRQIDAAAVYQNASSGPHWLGVIIEHDPIN